MAARNHPIPYGKQWLDSDDIEAVTSCLKSDWLTQGPSVERFEKALAEYTGAQFAIAVSSGTAALHLLSLGLGVSPGDVGVTTPITFVASANAILYAGGRVRFADVDPNTALIDPSEVRALCVELKAAGRSPKVLIPVSMTGHVANLPEIQRIAAEFGTKVIEDAAHSLGATYSFNGAQFKSGSCSHTDAAILSFHPVKHITTCEGGAVMTNDSALCAKIKDLRTHGIHKDPKRLTRPDEGPWYYEQDQLGFHYRISDVQCALGLSQLKKLDSFLQRRRQIASRYDSFFAKEEVSERIRPLKTPSGQNSAYHLYVVRVQGQNTEDIASRRKNLYLFLKDRNIFAQIHYIPVHWQPFYKQTQQCSVEDCPRANEYYAGCLSLPMFPKMSDSEQDRVLNTLSEWCRI